jgi:putative ABC transport system permease protein
MLDVRYALRALLARPAFTLVATLTLALGIGANTAVFTVVNGVLLRPLPYADPSGLVLVAAQTPHLATMTVSYLNFADWRDRTRSFSGLAAVKTTEVTLADAGDAVRLPGKMITANLLPLLGVQPVVGREFQQKDDRPGAEAVVLVSHALWQTRFGGSPSIIGRALVLDHVSYTVVGVLPEGFRIFSAADVYLPLEPWAATLPDDRGWHPGILAVARLAPGVSVADAQREMDAVSRQLEAEYPEANRDYRARVSGLQDELVRPVRTALVVLLGAVSLVLLIACANVANLLLARAIGRQKEIAVRTAIGAGRGRLLRQLLTESLVLACLGGLAGLLVAWWGIAALVELAGPALPRAEAIGLDWRVLLFALGLSGITGIVFGIAPALQTMEFDIRQALGHDSRGPVTTGARAHRLRSALVVVEVALALVLLVGAGLLIRSFHHLQQVPLGFDPHNLLVIDLPIPDEADDGRQARSQRADRLLARIGQLRGVRGAAVATGLPAVNSGAVLHFNIAGRRPAGPEDYTMAGYTAVSPGYIPLMGIPLRQGRLFTRDDGERAPPVVLINEEMALRFFAGVDPIGQRLQVGAVPTGADYLEVIGVVGNVPQSLESGPGAEMYVPFHQASAAVLAPIYGRVTLVARTEGPPLEAAAPVRDVIRRLDADQPLGRVRSMEEALTASLAQPRFRTTVLTLFAAMALTLALIGVYGVTAYGVSERAQEIGLRLALGASERDVVGMVVRHGARLASIGIALGLLVAALAVPALDHLLFDVSGLDALTFGAAALTLGLTALLASYLPARRAAAIPPFVALGR